MIRYTSKVRRGLVAMAELIDSAFDDSKPPVQTVTARWTKAKQAEFNLARDWVDQEAAESEPCGAAGVPTSPTI